MTRPLDDLLHDLDRRMDDDAPAVLVPVGLLRECRSALATAREDGAREEREAVVEFLQAEAAAGWDEPGSHAYRCIGASEGQKCCGEEFAAAIASGKHRP